MASAATEILQSPALYRDWLALEARFSDQDPNRHINNLAICQYMEEARVTLRRRHMTEADWANLNSGHGFVVASFRVSFLSAVTYPASLKIGNLIIRIGGKSYCLIHGVFWEERCVALGRTVTVACDRESGAALPVPEILRQTLASLLDERSEILAAADRI